MRVANWRAKEVFSAISESAIDEVEDIMSDVVSAAKAAVPVLENMKQERPDGWRMATISFTPKSGKNKGKPVRFSTTRQWLGRSRGDLQRTIRRVTADRRPGNVRVYAGNFKIYYAHMVEKTGYTDRKGRFHSPIPFLRNPFNAQKSKIVGRIKSRTDKTIAKVG